MRRCLAFHSKFIKNFIIVFDGELSEKVEMEVGSLMGTHNIVLIKSSSKFLGDKVNAANSSIITDWMCWLGDDDFILPSFFKFFPLHHLTDRSIKCINGVNIFIDEGTAKFSNFNYNIDLLFQYKSFMKRSSGTTYSPVIEGCLVNYPKWSASVIHGIIRTEVFCSMVDDFASFDKTRPSRWGDNAALCYLFASGRTVWVDKLFQVRSNGSRFVDISPMANVPKYELAFSPDFQNFIMRVLRKRFDIDRIDEQFLTEFIVRSSGVYNHLVGLKSLCLPGSEHLAQAFFEEAFSQNSLTRMDLDEIRSVMISST